MQEIIDSEKVLPILKSWIKGEEKLKSSYNPEIFQYFNIESLAYYYVCNSLNESYKTLFSKYFYNQNALDFHQEVVFKKLCQLFEENKIRYCPIKGADLAWRVYPTGALRQKCDLDILVHNDDCIGALTCLEKMGWNVPCKYTKGNHYPVISYQGVKLELHHNLPKFKKSSIATIWHDLIKINQYRYQLPLELNLLVLFNHCRNHHWQYGLKMLIDFGYLIQADGLPNLEKLELLSNKYQIASPKLLFNAFSDFFQPELNSNNFSKEECDILRKLVLFPIDLLENTAETVMSQADKFSFPWWRNRLRSYISPKTIRTWTNNPKGNYGKLILGYITVNLNKIRKFFLYRNGKKELKQYLHEAEKIENILRGTLDRK